MQHYQQYLTQFVYLLYLFVIGFAIIPHLFFVATTSTKTSSVDLGSGTHLTIYFWTSDSRRAGTIFQQGGQGQKSS